MTHICVSKLTIIGSDNGLSPGRCQAIIWTNAGILLIRTLWTNFSENLSKIHTFSFKKMHFKMSYANGVYFAWAAMCLVYSIYLRTYGVIQYDVIIMQHRLFISIDDNHTVVIMISWCWLELRFYLPFSIIHWDRHFGSPNLALRWRHTNVM